MCQTNIFSKSHNPLRLIKRHAQITISMYSVSLHMCWHQLLEYSNQIDIYPQILLLIMYLKHEERKFSLNIYCPVHIYWTKKDEQSGSTRTTKSIIFWYRIKSSVMYSNMTMRRLYHIVIFVPSPVDREKKIKKTVYEEPIRHIS